MRYIPYGYKIQNGAAIIDEKEAEQVRALYAEYLSGLSLTAAAQKVGIKMYHAGVKRLLQNERYLGDDYYPAIIDRETFEKAESERLKRAEALGRIRELEKPQKPKYPTRFYAKEPEQKYDDPFRQAEYAYSLIESEG